MPIERTLIGEAFEGDGANAAHVNSVLGRKGGPVETAWATALATPRQGHIPFVVAADEVEDLLLIAAVWVDWAADDESLVYANNAAATRRALEAAARGAPGL